MSRDRQRPIRLAGQEVQSLDVISETGGLHDVLTADGAAAETVDVDAILDAAGFHGDLRQLMEQRIDPRSCSVAFDRKTRAKLQKQAARKIEAARAKAQEGQLRRDLFVLSGGNSRRLAYSERFPGCTPTWSVAKLDDGFMNVLWNERKLMYSECPHQQNLGTRDRSRKLTNVTTIAPGSELETLSTEDLDIRLSGARLRMSELWDESAVIDAAIRETQTAIGKARAAAKAAGVDAVLEGRKLPALSSKKIADLEAKLEELNEQAEVFAEALATQRKLIDELEAIKQGTMRQRMEAEIRAIVPEFDAALEQFSNLAFKYAEIFPKYGLQAHALPDWFGRWNIRSTEFPFPDLNERKIRILVLAAQYEAELRRIEAVEANIRNAVKRYPNAA